MLASAIMASTAIAAPSNDHTNSQLAVELSAIVNAKAIERVAPKYPINEARKGNEAWVVVSYVIEDDGQVSNLLIEDSIGSKKFHRAAKEAVKKWRYEPAMENGEPITQCQNTVQLNFSMPSQKPTVSKALYMKYKELIQSLKEADESAIAKSAKSLESYNVKSTSESFFKQSALAEYAKYNKDFDQELKHLKRAVRSSPGALYNKKSNLTPKEKQAKQETQRQIYPVLHRKLVLELDKQMFANAKGTIERLLNLDVSADQHGAYQSQKEAIDALFASKEIVARPMKMEEDMVMHSLTRNTFSVDNINGKLRKLDVRCANKHHVYTVNEQSQWNLPDNWQGCSVYFYGDNNTEFTLLELPNKA